MPQCKARFCKVKRGQGISAFAIPDPKKNRQLCQQWIHNLGLKRLDIKTFKYSKHNIVCERHFEEHCFKRDKQVTQVLLNKGPQCRIHNRTMERHVALFFKYNAVVISV